MTTTEYPIVGFVAPGFEPVLEAFTAAIADDTDTGAALSIRQHGEVVTDLCGGMAGSGRAWQLDTPSVIFSSTKGVMSVLLARLVEEGRLDYDARVTDYWPEYGKNGKADTLVRHAISHRAGLSAPESDWTLADVLDWRRATDLLAEQQPLWEPGTGWAYHAITHGWLAGELVRRETGVSPGEYFSQLITAPLQLDAWIGLPTDQRDRVATMTVGHTLDELVAKQRYDVANGASVWPMRSLTLGGALPLELVGDNVGFNAAAVQAAQIPGAGGISSAHALATIWSATVAETNGVRLISDATIAQATQVQTEGAPHFDAPGPWHRWGMGFQLDSDARRLLGDTSFGHDGAGGQVAFADVHSRIGFAFLTNRMEADDERATDIVAALKHVLREHARGSLDG